MPSEPTKMPSAAYDREYVASMTVGELCDALNGQDCDALLSDVLPWVGRYVAADPRGRVDTEGCACAWNVKMAELRKANLAQAETRGQVAAQECVRCGTGGGPSPCVKDGLCCLCRENTAAASVHPHPTGLLNALMAEMARQDAKHGPFQGTRLGRSRLALACLEDELAEAKYAWRADRKLAEWPTARVEVLQVAAVAMRALRDAFNDDENIEGASNLVG